MLLNHISKFITRFSIYKFIKNFRIFSFQLFKRLFFLLHLNIFKAINSKINFLIFSNWFNHTKLLIPNFFKFINILLNLFFLSLIYFHLPTNLQLNLLLYLLVNPIFPINNIINLSIPLKRLSGCYFI